MTALYLLSIFDHYYDIIINSGIVATGHGQDVVDGLNANEKPFISMLMENVKFSSAEGYDGQVEMHTTTHKEDVSLKKELQQ